jgi:hypothetical protein
MKTLRITELTELTELYGKFFDARLHEGYLMDSSVSSVRI